MDKVEDEWDRKIESLEPLDLLYITYDAKKVTVDRMMEIVQEHEFKAEVKTEFD